MPPKAYAFALAETRLLDGPFKHAMSMDSAYIMLLKPDRLLYRFYANAGLPVKDSIYGGWESDGLSGHTLGHYLSAASMMYASTGEIEFKRRVDYIIEELKHCQLARGTGYIGAIPNEDSIWARVGRGSIKSSGFDLNGGWSPWYTVHKVMAGLMDAYLYTENKNALHVAIGMADWTYTLLKPLNDSTRLKMLNCEYGGMNEVLANIYAATGDKKYLDCADFFRDEFVMGKLARKIDPMPGKHSNTNVPKAISAARQYELTGSLSDQTIASFFWESMVNNHSYVIGGNSSYEYCGEPGKLSDRLSDQTCETCNTYNMLKLTRHLMSWEPNARMADYYERALYNHILSSQNPDNGMMTYFVPLRMGAQKQFSDSFHTFTCCVGSGLENHSKYAENIYMEGIDGSLYVNLFIPSELYWTKNKTTVRQETSFPYSNITSISLHTLLKQSFSIRIRKPSWCNENPIVKVNGNPTNYIVDSGYMVIRKTWSDDDRIDVEFKMTLYAEAMPDNPDRIALMYGPIVLAGRLGKPMPDPVLGIPVVMTSEKDPAKWVTTVSRESLTFKMDGVGKPQDVVLEPFYKVYDEHYSVYWDRFTPAQYEARQKEYQAQKEKEALIEKRTIDLFRLGEMQPERDHQLEASEKSYVSDALGRNGREARSGAWFSFTMKVEPEKKQSLLCTYFGDDKDRSFEILIDDTTLVNVDWKGGKNGQFYDVEYSISPELLKNKNTIRVKVLANKGRTAGRIFAVRTLKNQ